MICIFCLQSRPSSLEHIFPKAIGGTLTSDRVCKTCNDKLGSEVDVLLTDHIFIQFRRSALGLAGQSGKVPNAAEKLLGRGVMANDPEQNVRVLTNPTTGMLEPRILPKRTSSVLSDGTRRESMAIDAATTPDEIQRIILRMYKRAGVAPPPDEELDKMIADLQANVVTVERPEVTASIQVDIVKYKRSLLKIAYELACIWLGEDYLGDPQAATIRDVVLGRVSFEEAKVRGTADMARSEALRFWPSDHDTHIAYAVLLSEDIIIVLKIFEIFFLVVQVTERASLYGVRDVDAISLRFVEILVPAGKHRESSFADEIARLSRL